LSETTDHDRRHRAPAAATRRLDGLQAAVLAAASLALAAVVVACGSGTTQTAEQSSRPDAGATPATATAGSETGAATTAGPAEAGGGGSSSSAATAQPVAGAPAQTAIKQFPPQDHLEKVVRAYRVANQYPELLTGLPCYCPCELYGHGGVIDCHRSEHSASCNICMDEAIEAAQHYEAQMQVGEASIAAAQAAIKDRYRRALMAQKAQELPMMNTQQGQAFLQVCSDCHQPPSPAMHTSVDWDRSLARMEQYARQSDSIPPDASWQAAVDYVKNVAAQVPPSTVTQVRQSLADTVEHLKHAEGDAAYYPSARDEVLDPAWAERMAAAYAKARELPAELLASTPTACQTCLDAGHGNLLACLNSWHAITCETAIAEVEQLAAGDR